MHLLIVDDHSLIRDGIQRVVTGHEPAAVVSEAADLAAGLQACAEHPDLDLVLLDLHLPDCSDLEGLAAFNRARPDLPVVVLSSDDDPQIIGRAMEQGASGYIPKSTLSPLLMPAIHFVLAGGVYIPPSALQRREGSGVPPLRGSGGPPLTLRQRDILRLLSEGKPNKEIARDLELTLGTVKTHVSAVLRSIGVRTRTEAVVEGQRLGIVPPRRS